MYWIKKNNIVLPHTCMDNNIVCGPSLVDLMDWTHDVCRFLISQSSKDCSVCQDYSLRNSMYCIMAILQEENSYALQIVWYIWE